METLYLPKGERPLTSLIAFVSALSKGCAWEISIKRSMNSRTVQQCRYLNGVAYKKLGDATGYDRDDISEYLCGLYWGTKPKRKPGGKIEDVPLRTTTTNFNGMREVLSKQEFSDYVEFVQRFGAEHGVMIPDPGVDLIK